MKNLGTKLCRGSGVDLWPSRVQRYRSSSCCLFCHCKHCKVCILKVAKIQSIFLFSFFSLKATKIRSCSESLYPFLSYSFNNQFNILYTLFLSFLELTQLFELYLFRSCIQNERTKLNKEYSDSTFKKIFTFFCPKG